MVADKQSIRKYQNSADRLTRGGCETMATRSTRGLISFFSGPGGLDEGFRQADFATRLAYDSDAAAVRTLRRNHPGIRVSQRDITRLTVEEVVTSWKKQRKTPPIGVVGGAPCQSFSKGNVFQSSRDPRNTLPWHFARLVEGLNAEFQIDFFLFENVPGLASRRHNRKLKRLTKRLDRAGFNIIEGLLDARNFGLPQVRPRLFVVGLNRQKHGTREYCLPTSSRARRRTVADAIRHLPEPLIFSRQLNGTTHSLHPNHWCMAPKSNRFDGTLLADPRKRSFRVLAWDRPSYTVAYGHREVHVHPSRRRRLSVYEAMLLQGFPRGYELVGTLSDQIRLVSEAVPPPVARTLATSLRKQLGI